MQIHPADGTSVAYIFPVRYVTDETQRSPYRATVFFFQQMRSRKRRLQFALRLPRRALFLAREIQCFGNAICFVSLFTGGASLELRRYANIGHSDPPSISEPSLQSLPRPPRVRANFP